MNEEQPVKIKIDNFERRKANKISTPLKSPMEAPEGLRHKSVFLSELSAERLRPGRINKIDDFIRQSWSESENYGAIEELSANIKSPKEKKEDKSGAWLKVGKLSLYLLVFLLPLFFLPLTIAPVEANKQILASVLVLISFICYLANSIETRKIVYRKSLLGLAVLSLLAVFATSAVFSQAKSASIFGDFIQPDSLLCFVVYSLVFYLAGIFFRKKDFRKIAVVFFASLVLTAVFGLLQMFGYFILPYVSPDMEFTKQTGFNSLGSFSNWSIFIAFGLVLIASALAGLRLSLIPKAILAVIALFIVGELVIINYSFLWTAIALCMLILTAYCFTVQKKINIPMALMIASLFLTLISSSLPAVVKTPVEIRPSFSSTFDIAKETIWPKANRPLIENGKNILLGSGPATFGYDYSLYRPKDLNQTDFWQVRFNQGFSFAITLLATGGLLGILAVLFLILSFARQALKSLENKEALAGSVGALFMIITLFVFPPSIVQFVFVFLALGLMMSESSAREISFLNVSKTKSFLTFITFTVFIVGSMALSYLVCQKYVAAVYYKKGISAYNQSGDLIESLVNINRASALDPESDQYLRAFSRVLLLDVGDLIGKSKDDVSKASESGSRIQNEISLAVQTARKATVINPADSLNWNNLANVYENIMLLTSGADKFAAENYKKAIQLDPQNPAGYVDLARVLLSTADYNKDKDKYLWQKSIEEAKSSLEKSLELKADYATPRFMIALIYAREGKTQDAIGKMEETKPYAPSDAGLAFQLGVLYYNDNQLDKAGAEFERAVGLNGNYSNARYSLGLVYDKLGKKQMAIDQFEEVAKLNPENEEVKRMLENLKKGGSALEEIAPLPAEKADIPLSGEKQEKEINDLNSGLNDSTPLLKNTGTESNIKGSAGDNEKSAQ